MTTAVLVTPKPLCRGSRRSTSGRRTNIYARAIIPKPPFGCGGSVSIPGVLGRTETSVSGGWSHTSIMNNYTGGSALVREYAIT